ncbi:MAG: YggS family pyridoxal phosphate-dependent enzyme [Desulfobulbaceae bacterium]|nr:YggS family pyridoxal phosphate-dependent enzyme [Desulfobulbaceae bacterium]
MICKNLQTIRCRIAEAAERSGRKVDAIKLSAVSKRKDADKISLAIKCGQRIFGENYLQEAEEKIKQLSGEISWHFIGHLQSNKAKLAVRLFDVIETVDRLKIAKALDRHARELGKNPDILIQVNIGRELQKSGVLPENLEQLLQQIKEKTSLRVCGLMAMPPYSSHPEKSRPYFKELKTISIQLARKGFFTDTKHIELSMGMSGDFTVAIEEGATLVRVGTAIFGARNQKPLE